MKVYELPAQVNTQGITELSDTVLHQLPHSSAIEAIIMDDDKSEDESNEAWRRLASEQLLKGYSEEDAIYNTI